MIHILRKNMQWLLVLVAAIVILSFVWFYNSADIGRIRSSYVAQAYGKPISTFELNSLRRYHELARDLGMYGLLAGLDGFSDNDKASQDFLWNLYILRHESEALDIRPTDAEIKENLKQLPVFQTDGNFDPAKFALVTGQVLPTRGFAHRQLDEVVSDQIRLQKLRSLVGASITVSPDQARTLQRRQSEKLHTQVVRLKRDAFLQGSDPSEDEIRAEYDRRKDKLTTTPKRQLRYAKFQLTDQEKKLEGAERLKVLQTLADRSDEFCQKMLQPDAKFVELARQYRLETTETRSFADADPDPELAKIPGALNAATLLRPEDPNSDPIQMENGFVVLRLEHFEPSRPMTLQEAKADIAAELKNERAEAKLKTRGNELRAQLQSALESGKGFADAARGLGLEPVTIPPFSLAEPAKDAPDAGAIHTALTGVEPGGIGQFTETDSGGMIAFLESREAPPADQAEEQVAAITRQLRFVRQSAAFQEWLRLRREAAGIRT